MEIRNKEKGSFLVETALVVPVMLLLFMLGFDLIRAMSVHSAIKKIAYEGYRSGSLNDSLVGSTVIDDAGNVSAEVFWCTPSLVGTITNCSTAPLPVDNGHAILHNRIQNIIDINSDLRDNLVGFYTNKIDFLDVDGQIVNSEVEVFVETRYDFLFDVLPTGSGWLSFLDLSKSYRGSYTIG